MRKHFNVSVDKILLDSKDLFIEERLSSDLVSYFEFINFFKRKNLLNKSDVIIGANFSYGWMPTILKLKDSSPKQLQQCVLVLNKAKEDYPLNHEDYLTLKATINNSIVGASKLLHFVNPSKFAIWDSRVANYFGVKKINDLYSYSNYLDFCRAIPVADLKAIHQNVGKQVPELRRATKLRALEFVLFNHGLRKSVQNEAA